MAVWSIVKASELEGPRRLDAEYYRPEYVELSRRLARCSTVTLEEVARVTDGIHASPKFQPGSGIRYVSAKCVRDCYFDLTTAEELSNSQHAANPRTALRVDDVIVSTVGTIGFCAVVDQSVLPANCDRHVGIVRLKDNKRLDPYFVAAFLNSKYGRYQTIREATGNVQLNLFIYAIDKLRVPYFAHHRNISGMVQEGLRGFQESESLYRKAERLVLDEIGWEKLNLSQSKWWAVPLSRARGTSRLDAEHFQPKYDKLVAHLQKAGKAKQLKEVLAEPIQKGVTPDYDEAGSIAAINSQHLGRSCLNFDAVDRTTEDFWRANKRAQIRHHDVMIYATGAYIGRTNAYLETARALAGVDILLVRPGKECHPVYLAVFLNLSAGLMQAKQFASGSGQAHIYPDNVASYWVALPAPKTQEQVVTLVRDSYTARQKAKALLAEAKAKVEAVIEGRR